MPISISSPLFASAGECAPRKSLFGKSLFGKSPFCKSPAELSVGLTRRALLTSTAAGAVATAGLGLTGFASTARAEVAARFLRIGTGTTTGTYFPIGSLIAGVISKPPGLPPCEEGGSCGVPGLIAAAQATKGSIDNLDRIAAGELDLALTQADVAFWAHSGTGVYRETGPVPGVTAIARLFPEAVHLVVKADSLIRSVVDLKGKRVSGGNVGSGTLADSELLLAAYGIEEGDYEPYFLAPSDAADALINDKLDAFFLIAGHPTRVIDDLAQRVPIRLISITGERADEIIAAYPYFAKVQIPAALYKDVPMAHTIAVGALLVARADIAEDLVYELTAAMLHERAKAIFAAGHPMAKEINLARALESIAIPLHPGAARFYDEVGLLTPTSTD